MKLPPVAVLIPYSKGTFVYAQTDSQNMHLGFDTPHPRKILGHLESLPPLRLVAFLDNTLWIPLAVLLLEQTDLCLIPDPWLKHIPRQQPRHRAEFALHLLEAYFEDPIRLLGAKDRGPIPESTLTQRTGSWTTLLKRS